VSYAFWSLPDWERVYVIFPRAVCHGHRELKRGYLMRRWNPDTKRYDYREIMDFDESKVQK